MEAAKGLRDFAKDHPALVVKGGVVDGRPVDVDEIRRLADLESREVLLAKMAGALQPAGMSQAAALFAAPLSQAARLAQALADAGGAPAGAPARGRADVRRADPGRSPADGGADPGRRGRPASAEPAAAPTPDRTRTRTARSTRTQEERPWPSSAPTSCSTRSRR